VLLAWSSGKDAAWTLHTLSRRADVEVVALLTTVDQARDRVAMHGVRRTLLEDQARAAGLPLWPVPIPDPCPNEAYEAAMEAVVRRAKREGIEAVAFGDLFLEDVRRYREQQMANSGLDLLFPLWGRPTAALADEMIAAGLKAVLVSVDTRALPASFAGHAFAREMLGALPAGVDPCGENGEFHTFAWDGPMFSRPVPVRAGDVVVRDGFAYADLLAASAAVESAAATA
jgi:uncharacterized protein (TIGR00290 family)